TPCEPNPCPQGKSVCSVQNGMIVCQCDAGTHDETATCVPDLTCLPTTCSGHGACSEVGGVLTCACDPGWAQPSCAMCDNVLGYHPDGMGRCTHHPRLPHPCVDPNRTVCVDTGGVAMCACDAGYHDDGIGG